MPAEQMMDGTMSGMMQFCIIAGMLLVLVILIASELEGRKIGRRSRGLICCTALLFTLSSPLPSFAQDQQEPAGAEDIQEGEEDRSQMGQASPEMREMANAMKSMAEMCEMMMQREMEGRPLKMTAAAVLGTLLTLALLLFVVLEIQWIRFWSLRIKTERKKLND